MRKLWKCGGLNIRHGTGFAVRDNILNSPLRTLLNTEEEAKKLIKWNRKQIKTKEKSPKSIISSLRDVF